MTNEKNTIETIETQGEMKMETETETKTETKTETFVKTKVLDIDTFETVKDEKTFDLETGKRVGFIRTIIFQDYTGGITVRTKVIQ